MVHHYDQQNMHYLLVTLPAGANSRLSFYAATCNFTNVLVSVWFEMGNLRFIP